MSNLERAVCAVVSVIGGLALTVVTPFVVDRALMAMFSRYYPNALSHPWDVPLVISLPVFWVVYSALIWRVWSVVSSRDRVRQRQE